MDVANVHFIPHEQHFIMDKNIILFVRVLRRKIF